MILELKGKLIKVLVDKGLLKPGDLEKAISVQKTQGGSLSDILVGLSFVTRSDLMIALSQGLDRKSTRLNSSHRSLSRMPSSA